MKNAPDMIILGSTGSVGQQAIDVARQLNIKVNALSAHKDVKTVEAQAREFGVTACAMSDEQAARDLKARLADTDVKVYSGSEGICQMIEETKSVNDNGQIIENSILGEAGLKPTMAALRSESKLALANKESLVVGGDAVMKLARENGKEILPVDSEHCAIFQCLRSGKNEEIKNIILTASGGPFFGYTSDMLKEVTLEKTLAHPTWNMGAKITVDSATLMNKGFEIIEAAHLFSVSAEQIEVVVHRESILHSAVEYIDNTIVGEMSLPDMRSCVQYAVDYPERFAGVCKPLDFASLGKMTFAKPDEEAFPLLSMAKRSLSDGGAMSAVLNAADEIAVDAFLKEKISFCDIFDSVISTYERMSAAKSAHTLEEIISADREARKIAQEYAK